MGDVRDRFLDEVNYEMGVRLNLPDMEQTLSESQFDGGESTSAVEGNAAPDEGDEDRGTQA
jgi:hypothetical protein